MSKVVLFRCSPRKNGTTAALLAEVARGAQDAGSEVLEYDLNAANIQGCQACDACARPDAAATCIQQDYLEPMYADLQAADAIVVGSPIYMGSLTAQAWLLLNRLRPTTGSAPTFSPKLPGKRFVTVVSYANPDPQAYRAVVEALQAQLARRGWQSVGSLVWAGARDRPPAELQQAAFAAGQQLIK
jgi:multimeric flavodoxin WrbA